MRSPDFVEIATSAVRTKSTRHRLISELWLRETWWTRTGLTLEQAWALYSPVDFNFANKYWEIEAKIANSQSGSSQSADVTEAAFQALKQGGNDGVH